MADDMTFVQSIRTELTAATRARDNTRRDTLRLIVAALDNARIEAGHDLDKEESLRVLHREARQRRDSIEEFQKAGRQDLVDVEERELAIIGAYLPAELTEEELLTAARAVIEEVGAAGPGDMGKVMGPLMQRLGGGADGRRVNTMVRELLASA